MSGRRFEPWPALADLTFVLFVCLLAAAVAYARQAEDAEDVDVLRTELTRARAEIERIKSQAHSCGGARPLLVELAGCMDVDTVPEGDCSITFGEDVVHFAYDSAVPVAASRASADRLAACLWSTAWTQRDALEGVEGLYIDGHTDCSGGDKDNVDLGARRAQWVYDAVFRDARDALYTNPVEARSVLRTFRVRSFGDHMPTERSACAGADVAASPDGVRVAADRRVTVSIIAHPVHL